MTYEYDSLDRLERIRDGGVQIVASFAYDALSRRISMTRANGAGSSWQWDVDDDLELLTHDFAGSSASWEYTYSQNHQRLSATMSDPQFLFDLSQLAPTTYTNDGMNRQTSAVVSAGQGAGVGFSFGHDTNGNLGSPISNDYVFDFENRLVEARMPGNVVATYEYDSASNRVGKAVQGSETQFVLDGNQVLEEYAAGGALTRRFLHSGLDEPVRMIRYPGGTSTHVFHQDGLGSVVALSDSGGTLAEAYAYGPYGEVTSAGAITSPILYTGREYDAESGLYYYRARHYDAEIGRFLQPDPSGYADGLNVYLYVGANPINFVDPLGLFGRSLDRFQTGLDVFGLGAEATGFGAPLSIGTDLLNAGISLGRGDFLGAGLSSLAAVPFLGIPANGARLLRAGDEVANAGGAIRSFVTESDQTFFRVFSGDAAVGGFLTAVPPRSSEFAREALALPRSNSAKLIQEVFVPAGTRLQRSRVLPIRQADDLFPVRRGGAEQFQLLDRIAPENFGPGVPLP